MNNEMTVTMSAERYNELIQIETIYNILKRRVILDEYRSDIDCLLLGLPTRAEEKEFREALDNNKAEIDEDDDF